jgi:hypothetical protein
MKRRVGRKRSILDVTRDESAVATRPALHQENVQSGGAIETEPEASQSPAAPSRRKGRWRTVSPQGHAKQSRR